MRPLRAMGLILWLSALAPLAAQDVPKEALYEIGRRGTAIERVGDVQDSGQAALFAAAETPPDDSGKWFLSIICKKGDAASEQLRADLAGCEVLKKWVDVADYKASYMHFQTFQAEDKSQDWRLNELKQTLAELRIDRYPVLFVNPPLNGAWGDPHTVVLLKAGYNNRPDQLDKEIRDAINLYSRRAASLHAKWQARQPVTQIARGFEQQAGPALQIGRDDLLFFDGAAGRDCPFPVCPKLEPPTVRPTQNPLIPPTPQPTLDDIAKAVAEKLKPPPATPAVAPAAEPTSGTGSLWTTLILGGLGLSGLNVVTIGLSVWAVFRAKRQAAGQPTIPEPIYQDLVAVLKALQKPAS
jgi:hypothetical protein